MNRYKFFMIKEIWKRIIGFENFEVSNLGRVKSYCNLKVGKILIHSFDQRGYCKVNLRRADGKSCCRRIHVLVWDHFGSTKRNGRIINIDHIDFNKSNNWIDNLQLLTSRQNFVKSIRSTGKMLGAMKKRDKWSSRICVNGTYRWLGVFDTELEAHKAYMAAVKEVECVK